MSKTREQFPLSFKKIIKKTITSTIGYIILLVILLFISAYGTESVGQNVYGMHGIIALGFVIFIFLTILISYLYQRWYFAVYFYDLNMDYIQVKKGPITPREITIPYERIQDIYVDQDLLDRIFGLYDVHLSSATASSGMEAHIDGLEKNAAEGLRTMLLQTVQQRISKNKSVNVTTNNPVL